MNGLLIKQDDVKRDEICALKATNREILIAHINAYLDGTKNKTYLRVELSGEQLGCVGGSVDYTTEADVPYHSVPCPCGNPKHWLIKYEEEA